MVIPNSYTSTCNPSPRHHTNPWLSEFHKVVYWKENSSYMPVRSNDSRHSIARREKTPSPDSIKSNSRRRNLGDICHSVPKSVDRSLVHTWEQRLNHRNVTDAELNCCNFKGSVHIIHIDMSAPNINVASYFMFIFLPFSSLMLFRIQQALMHSWSNWSLPLPGNNWPPLKPKVPLLLQLLQITLV